MQNNELITPARLSTILQLLYNGVPDGNWQPFLQQVMLATSSNKAFISVRKTLPDSPLFMSYIANFDSPAEAIMFYQQHPRDDPFWIEYVRYLPEGENIEPEYFMDINDYKNTEFSHKVLVPLRSHYVLGALLLRDNEHDAFFILNRDRKDTPYGVAERQLIEQLKPHVQQAVRLFTLFRDISQQHDMLKAVLDQNDKALMIINTAQKLIMTNRQADTLLETLPYWSTTGGNFVLRNSAEQRRFTALLQSCMDGDLSDQDRLYLQLGDNEMQLFLALSPLQWLQLDNQQHQAYCLVTLSYRHRISWSALQTEYGLTKRELELVQALHNNCKLTELSEQMAVSYNTLRRHLQAVFKKCRVNSQSELMLLLSRFG